MKPDEAHLLQALCEVRDPAEMRRVLSDLLTRSEAAALHKRWAILCLLRDGVPQREIARRTYWRGARTRAGRPAWSGIRRGPEKLSR